ncbi:class I SAM-dependent methyltransferase [Anoxybacteroides tepidamans]|uniref:class I SAM-dependent methyltransferase n=1 Tax=Anoxybacteroides tepidamans TaxID=265948 RepID=UPI0004828FCB|nr:class I SAM-dependent methyltransferase [Anoxybacillus tepidamans]
MTTYLDVLAELGIDSAHPGGFLLTKNILRKLNITPSTHILDVGCGTGRTAAYISETYGAHVTAIDIHPKMLEKAKARFSSLSKPVELHKASIESLPFPSEQFDIILCESVLSFVTLPKALKEIYRTLKPHGTFIGIEAAHSQLSESAKKDISAFYQFRQLLTKKEWRTYLSNHGFRNIQIAAYTATEHPALQSSFTIRTTFSHEMLAILSKHEQLKKQYGKQLGYCIFSCQK